MLLDENIGYIAIYVIMYCTKNPSIISYPNIIIIINIRISVIPSDNRTFVKINKFCVLYIFLLKLKGVLNVLYIFLLPKSGYLLLYKYCK